MLNRTVWILWLQGWDQAPWLVREVAESWRINNPTWDIKLVSLANIGRYTSDIDYIYDKEIIPQTKSDIIRLSLLKNHGGVWADATLLCMQPLDHWIDDAVDPAGLWMYHGTGAGMRPHQGPAIWFIASHANSLMISRWKQASDEYWSRNNFTKGYFWLDQLFRDVFEGDAEFRKTWQRAPYIYCNADGQAHMLAPSNGSGSTVADDRIKDILEKRPPYVLKLWKRWADAFDDINSDACKKSNGYWAIQMSKREVIYKHRMMSKSSLVFFAYMAALYGKRKYKHYSRKNTLQPQK